MANVLNNIKDVGSVIAKLAAGYLADENQLIKTIDKEPASSFGQVNGYKVGDTININKPARFTVNSTADITSAIQDVKEEKVSLALSNQYNVPIALTSSEIATKMDVASWAARVLKPAMITLGNTIEKDVLTSLKNSTYNTVGTAGATTFDTDTMLAAREKLMKNLVPDNNLFALLDSTAQRSAVNSRKGLFNKTEEIAKQYKGGYMGNADGFEYLENNLLPTHTRGTATGSITVTSTLSTEGGTTIALTGTGSQTLKKGDVFTIANVYAVHPVTKQTMNYLQQFVVQADNTASSGSYTGVSILPAIYTSASGGLQSVDSFPQGSAAVTLVGSASTGHVQNFAFHPSAVRLASVPLIKPDGLDLVAQETVDGITVRIVRDYDVLKDRLIMRADVLWGVAVVRPEWSCRVTA